MMKIKVMSRKDAEKYASNYKHIFISITSPSKDIANISISENCIDILRLSFHDCDGTNLHERSCSFKKLDKIIYFNEHMARQIINFVKKYENQVEEIAVHCEAGISRSAGCAAAIACMLEQSDVYFFARYLPNSLVYNTILRTWFDDPS